MWSSISLIASFVVVLFSVGIYQFHALYLSITPCADDPPIVGASSSHYSWDACHVFSLEYAEARDKFRAAAQQVNAEMYSLPILVDDDDNTDSLVFLTTDIAILKGNRPGIILHSSATHGVEGYAGSAIQLAILAQGVLPNDDRPTIMFIHAVNPYGMKHYRRPNEHNVDLNRNAILNFEQFLQNRPPNIAGYDTFRDFISPQRAPTTWYATFGFWCTFIPLLLQEGYTSVKRILVAGQYHHAEGAFYGGTQLEPSLAKLQEFIDQHFDHLLGENSEDPLVWIDVHTGLGKFGKDTLLFEETATPVSTLERWFPTAEGIVTAGVVDKKALSGYKLVKGNILSYFQLLLLQSDDNGDENDPTSSTLFLVQEFGTLPGVLVGRALVLENAIYHHGNNNKRDNGLGRQWMQSAFYPQSTAWRASIVQRGVATMLQAIEYVNTQSRSRETAKNNPTSKQTTNY